MKTLLLSAAVMVTGTIAVAQGMPGQHFVESWDLDGDGQVTLAEATERRGDVFVTFDADENGYLGSEEYALFDEARANDMAENAADHGKGMMRRAGEGMSLQFNDSDGDGRVSRDEFLGNTNAWIALLDRDGNGAVTTDDFGRREKGASVLNSGN